MPVCVSKSRPQGVFGFGLWTVSEGGGASNLAYKLRWGLTRETILVTVESPLRGRNSWRLSGGLFLWLVVAEGAVDGGDGGVLAGVLAGFDGQFAGDVGHGGPAIA